MPTPSLLIVPARFKSGKLYSQIPTSGAGDFTVTRATTATRVNASGLIESVASGIPRLDYFASGGTVGCPALLVEPSAQNLVLQSTFSTGWSTSFSGSVSGNASGTNSPEGSGNAALLSVLATAFSSISRTITTVSGSVYTASVFAKKRDKNFLYFVNLAGNAAVAWFNLASGTVGTVGANTTARIENYGNGWYRCSITQTVGGTTSYIQFGLSDADNTNAAASSGSNFVFGAQFELSSVPTSYIPTTTGSITRNADVVSVSGAVSGSIGQTSGTIYCEFAYFGQPVVRSGPIYLRQAASRGMSINFSPSDSPTGISFLSRNDGGSTVLTIVSGALQIGTFYKIAIGYDAAGTAVGGSQASGVVAYVNGVQTAIGTFRVPDAAGLKEFRMYGANSGTDAEAFNGRIRAAALYTTRLSNAELAALTSL